jgi:hypothetical protein
MVLGRSDKETELGIGQSLAIVHTQKPFGKEICSWVYALGKLNLESL